MTNLYNTGNPVGSTDPRDLYDNASNFDEGMNAIAPSFTDRKGVLRKAWSGMETEFSLAQSGRTAEFQTFLESSGFVSLGNYASGIEFTAYNQYIAFDGFFYRPAPSSIPFVTSGTWSGDEDKFILMSSEDLLRQDLANSLDPAKGADLVGYKGQTVFSKLESIPSLISAVVTSISGLRLLESSVGSAFASGYYLPFDGGGGAYTFDPSDTVSADNGGTVIVAADGGRWKLSYTGMVSVRQFGARGDNSGDDRASIQSALDSVKSVFLPNGIYRIGGSLAFNFDGCSLNGENMKNTVIASSGTFPSIHNPDKATTTRLFCAVKDLLVTNDTIGSNILVDWKSIQFGEIHRVWLLGQAVAGCILLNLEAVWAVTECTYNTISNCYMGITTTCVSITDGANNNCIRESRFQPTTAGGIGVYLFSAFLGRVSSNTIRDNGFEYPGAINTGINVLGGTDGTRITGNRFEQLATGIVVGANNLNTFAPRAENYFEGCTVKINLSAGGTGTPMRTVAAISGDGSGGWLTNGNAYNLTATRGGVGSYQFAFTGGTLPDAGYVVKACSILDQTLVSGKTQLGFTVLTRNNVGTNVDSPIVDVSVEYNK